MMRAALLALALAGCQSITVHAPTTATSAVIIEQCEVARKPAVAPHNPPDADVFAQLKAVTVWSSDVQIAREDTVRKLEDCTSKLERAQEMMRTNAGSQ